MKELSENYFSEVDDQMLAYLTEEAINNIDLFTGIYHANRDRAVKLAMLLATGCGTPATLALTGAYIWWLLSLSVAWGLCALLLSINCVRTQARMMHYADPYSLYANEPHLPALKRKRLYDYTLISRQIQGLGIYSGRWFNWILTAAVVSPLVTVLVFGVRCLAQ